MLDAPQEKLCRRWFRLTPDRSTLLLLALEGLLLPSKRFQWLALNRHKGWPALVDGGLRRYTGS